MSRDADPSSPVGGHANGELPVVRADVCAARVRLTQHFSPWEFRQMGGPRRVHGGWKEFPEVLYPEAWYQEWLLPLCQFVLEVIRHESGDRLITVDSGFRTEELNSAIGGKLHSQHLIGKAADIVVAGLTAKQAHDLVIDLWAAKKLPTLGGLGLYPNFIHVDIRKNDDGHLSHWVGERTIS